MTEYDYPASTNIDHMSPDSSQLVSWLYIYSDKDNAQRTATQLWKQAEVEYGSRGLESLLWDIVVCAQTN
jgi:hypothetical protein